MRLQGDVWGEMAKEVKSNFGSDGVKTVKPPGCSTTDVRSALGIREESASVSTGTGCDGGFPEKIKAHEKDLDNEEEDTSNSSGVQSNSNYSEDFSDGDGGPGGGGLHYSAGSGRATDEILY